MKTKARRWVAANVVLVLAASGCDVVWSDVSGDCELMLTCGHFLPTGSGGGPPNPACEADPTKDASTVTDECAVFASATAEAGGDGTKAKPYASLGEAVANAKGKRVLACTSEPFVESVTIDAGVEVIGGFDCEAGWTWSESARSGIEGPAGVVALTLGEGANGATVRSFAVSAASATEPGGSSIGVAVADVEAELAEVDVTAGDGMAGANGETPTEAPQAGASAPAELSNACSTVVFGGESGVTTCEDGETRGGVGGLGGMMGTDEGNGQKGADGAPLPEPNPDAYGLGGAGQTDSNCRRGEDGLPGTDGETGEAGSGTELTLADIAGGDGGEGKTGKKGQGGGGGGGAKAGLFCGPSANPMVGPGASGGGGGAGGCGGKGGGGGKAGGSSIGLVSLGTKLMLTDVTVTVGKAGKGGDGARGLGGAAGGSGATGGTATPLGGSIGCRGGDGGQGGMGGPGAGGRGGHAVGIAYGVAPGAAVTLASFIGGTAGEGGGTAPGGNAGEAGVSGECWDFTGNASCGQ
ncbi:putative secreted protein [Sorangium cellulosum So ce56]|uniref:Secreted protein n=2 Tax=Sorangium cellulosum TaxID=56 RepID=A9EMW7_SORC5|nr:putative secreted protein [Sorangium cellulosum So ce56]